MLSLYSYLNPVSSLASTNVPYEAACMESTMTQVIAFTFISGPEIATFDRAVPVYLKHSCLLVSHAGVFLALSFSLELDGDDGSTHGFVSLF